MLERQQAVDNNFEKYHLACRAPLRNRTVDLLLTMSSRQAWPPQVRAAISENASPGQRSQALIELSRARFATQSATHFDLGRTMRPQPCQAWRFWVRADQHRMLVHGTDMQRRRLL
jgi:hypothetical protein